jgi:hypothetical protein
MAVSAAATPMKRTECTPVPGAPKIFAYGQPIVLSKPKTCEVHRDAVCHYT